MATANDSLFDFQVLQAIRWVRLGNSSAREIIAILNKVDSKLAYLLQESDLTSFSQIRAMALRKQIAELLKAAHLEVQSALTPLVVQTAMLAAELEQEALTHAVVGLRIDVVTPNPALIRTIALERPFDGALLSDWVSAWSEADIARTWRAVQSGMVAGETTEEIIKAVRGTAAASYGDGVREMSRRGAEALTRTAINHAASAGRQGTWDENEDIISKVRWVSTLDSRTTPICREYDGRVFPVTSGPRPPAHINCRSTTVAVLKSWREMGFDIDEISPGTRASMNGQVPSDMTYYQWLKSTSAANAEEALGKTRYKLWKDGGIDPAEFTNDKGHQYTLDELRKMRPQPFKRAGV